MVNFLPKRKKPTGAEQNRPRRVVSPHPYGDVPMRIAFVLIPLLAVMAVSACETVKGAGRDMQTAGAVVTSEAQEAKMGY
jgi:entericidin B